MLLYCYIGQVKHFVPCPSRRDSAVSFTPNPSIYTPPKSTIHTQKDPTVRKILLLKTRYR